MTLSLFDDPQRPARQSTTVPSEPSPFVPPPQSTTAPDIRRVIEHHRGLFRRVVDGAVTHEYRIVELHDGRIYEEWGDHCRMPSRVTVALIESSLESGMWREIT